MTMCEAKYPTGVAFTFLEALRKEFMLQFNQSDIDKASPYALNNAFKKQIMNKMVMPNIFNI